MTDVRMQLREEFARAVGPTSAQPAVLDDDVDFFDAGGDSLAALLLVRRCEELLETQIDALDFFEDPTPAGLLAAAGLVEDSRP